MRPHLSKGYDKNGAEIPQTLYINGLPAGSLRSNATDMAKYIQTILARGQNLLRPETLEAMLRPEDTYHSIDYTDNIGKVWMTQYPFGREHPVRAHNGAAPPFYSALMIIPAQNIGVFVSINTNAARGLPGDIAKYALKKALERKLGKPVSPPPRNPPAPPAQKLPKPELLKYTGFYVDTETSREIIMGKDDRLYLRVPAPNMTTKDIALTHLSDGTFAAPPPDARRLAFTGTGNDMVMYDIINAEKRTPAIKTDKPPVPPYFESWRGIWRAQTKPQDTDDEDDETPNAGGLPPMLVFGIRENAPYCMLRPLRFVDKATCYWETHGRSGGQIMKQQSDGTILFRGIVYKRMRQ